MPYTGNVVGNKLNFLRIALVLSLIFFCEELIPDDKGIIYKIASFLISEWAGRFLM